MGRSSASGYAAQAPTTSLSRVIATGTSRMPRMAADRRRTEQPGSWQSSMTPISLMGTARKTEFASHRILQAGSGCPGLRSACFKPGAGDQVSAAAHLAKRVPGMDCDAVFGGTKIYPPNSSVCANRFRTRCASYVAVWHVLKITLAILKING